MKLAGYVEGNTFIDIFKKTPAVSDDDIINAIMKTQDNYFSQGITMTQEGKMTKELIFLYRLMLDKLDLDLDIVYYINDDDIEPVLKAFKDTEAWYDKNVKYGGVNLPLTKTSEYNNENTLKTKRKELGNFIIETSFDQEIYDGLKLVSPFKVTPLVKINTYSGINQFINIIEKLKSIAYDLSEYRPILITSQALDKKQVQKIKT